MKTIKSFAQFSVINGNPVANVIDLNVTHLNKNKAKFKYHDNRFFTLCETDESMDFEAIEEKALLLGFVEVPKEVADILQLGNYWGNLSKIEKYATPEFIKATKITAGYDGTPDLG